MQRTTVGSLVIPALLLIGAAIPVQARALEVALPPQDKVKQADLVLTGQVVGIEDQDVKATVDAKNKTTAMYRVAVIQATDTLKGKIQGNLVRVGFQAPQDQEQPGQPGAAIQPAQPGVPIQIGGRQPGLQLQGFIAPGAGGKPQQYQLAAGQGGLFFLKKHHEGDFYTILPVNDGFISNENTNFDFSVAQVKVPQDPIGSLKAANVEDRVLAAAVLIKQYRQNPYGGPKGSQQQPIDAEESKLILKALLDGEWPTTTQGLTGINYQTSPGIVFSQLGLQQTDGWQGHAGKGVFTEEYVEAAKGWLAKNWQTYRIQKFVQPVATNGSPITDEGGDRPQPVPLPRPIKIQPLPVPGQRPIQIQPAPLPGNIKIQPGKIQIQPLPAPVPAPAPAQEDAIQPAPAEIQIDPANIQVQPQPLKRK